MDKVHGERTMQMRGEKKSICTGHVGPRCFLRDPLRLMISQAAETEDALLSSMKAFIASTSLAQSGSSGKKKNV